MGEIKDQIKEVESTVSLQQEHVKNFQKQLSVLECKNDELKQYSRRLYLRIEVFHLCKMKVWMTS